MVYDGNIVSYILFLAINSYLGAVDEGSVNNADALLLATVVKGLKLNVSLSERFV